MTADYRCYNGLLWFDAIDVIMVYYEVRYPLAMVAHYAFMDMSTFVVNPVYVYVRCHHLCS
jgi:hypothetical protein